MRNTKLSIPEGIRCFKENFGTHQLVIEKNSCYLTGRELFSYEGRFLGSALIWKSKIIKDDLLNRLLCKISSFGGTPKKVGKWQKGEQIILQSVV